MTQEEILEYNKRCAEFLGAKYSRDEQLSFEPKGRWFVEQFPDVEQDYNLKFHSDWNWIMEVIEAIEKLNVKNAEYASNYSVVTYNNSCYIEVCGYKSYTVIQEITSNSRKEAVVEAINCFLIWYNENK